MNDIKFPCNECCINANAELNKKYERLSKSYDDIYKSNKDIQSKIDEAIKDRDNALSKSSSVLMEKYDKIKRDYDSVIGERGFLEFKLMTTEGEVHKLKSIITGHLEHIKDLSDKDKDYKNLRLAYDKSVKNNDELKDHLKQLIDLKPTMTTVYQYAFALFVVGILPHLLIGRQL